MGARRAGPPKPGSYSQAEATGVASERPRSNSRIRFSGSSSNSIRRIVPHRLADYAVTKRELGSVAVDLVSRRALSAHFSVGRAVLRHGAGAPRVCRRDSAPQRQDQRNKEDLVDRDRCDEPVVYEGKGAFRGGISPPDGPAETSVAVSAQQPRHR